ncbi:MAG: DegT/DnrJ/EryC1/StrS family aminotransferase [Desulfovibrio sp.]|nr:DegT/DnrJ/EryC1/StrS family aminotransferase [Desulfovibrio sp.]
MDIRVNFSGRAIRYTEEEIAVVAEAMRTADPLTQGEYMRAFERKFAVYQGVPEGTCFTTMNGCAALEMSAQLCRFRPGDEVVIPSHTFTASAYPYLKKGARLVWADIDPVSRVVTAESIEPLITPRTKAVVVVHLYGYVADMPAIMALCEERGLICIEDAAQAIGAEVEGQKAGSFGHMGIFSFHSHKNLTTLGEGGMLYVKDPDLAAIIPALRHNGHCAYSFERADYWKPAMGNVDVPMLGNEMLMPSNYCLGEVECALGAKLLDRIDDINDEKRRRALRFIDALDDCSELEFHRVDSRRHNYHLLAARITAGPAMRDAFMRAMYEKKGIKCVVQYIPLDRYDFYRRHGLDTASCPHADAFFDSMVSFPFQHWLSEDDFEYMLVSTREVLADLR